MIATNNRKRRELINNWTPALLASEEGSHMYLYSSDKTFKDDTLLNSGENNEDVSVAKDLSLIHYYSTKVIEEYLL